MMLHGPIPDPGMERRRRVMRSLFLLVAIVLQSRAVHAVAACDGDRLVYAGKARTGYTMAAAREVRERLDPLIVKRSPLSVPVKKPKATWVEPVVQAEIEYGGITDDGLLREAVFKGCATTFRPHHRHQRVFAAPAPRINRDRLLGRLHPFTESDMAPRPEPRRRSSRHCFAKFTEIFLALNSEKEILSHAWLAYSDI